MKKYLHFGLSLLLLFVFANLSLAGKKSNNKINEHIYFDRGLKHHMVVMNKEIMTDDGIQSVTAVVDTIQHASTNFPEDWDFGIQQDAYAPDTVANWYWFAAEDAQLLAIQASFATTGTGSWNVWGSNFDLGYRLPGTDIKYLAIDVPWTIDQADTNEAGVPTGNWQTLDVQSLLGTVTIPTDGAYVGHYYDANGGPKMFMDDGDHPRTDPSWNVARAYLGAFGGWYFWATATAWTEFVQRIVVYYENVAPLIENLSMVPDYFEGNPEFDSITADIFDLDGTVASANLVWQVGAAGSEESVAMSNVEGDMWEGTIGTSFSAGDTVYYWVTAEDADGNFRQGSNLAFVVLQPPAKGTDVLVVNDGAEISDAAITGSLAELGKTMYLWDTGVHGGISDFEVEWGFDNIIWYGFGSGYMPSPFETGDNAVKRHLDGGGNLIVIDSDYLFVNGFGADTLVAGEFGYDYLGLHTGFSDPAQTDTSFFGMEGNPISGMYMPEGDTLVTYSNYLGLWYTEAPYATDWQDYLVPKEEAVPLFWNDSSQAYGMYSAIGNTNGTYSTAFFAFRLGGAEDAHIQQVLDSTLSWFDKNATAIDDNFNPVVSSYTLEQNYPNPFNPTTTINFNLPMSETVKLTIYNSLGQRVVDLVNQNMKSGYHSVSWNGLNDQGGKVSSGVYYYKLEAGDFSSVKKMLLLK